MDEIYERATVLENELEKFNDQLRGGFEDLRRSHDAVAPLWQDEMRREYDRTWMPLEESMDAYIKQVGPRYVEFLLERLQHLKAYLHGS